MFSAEDIEVGYEPTLYTTSEGERVVELTIVVFSHRDGGTPRPFTLSVFTENGTASTYIIVYGLMNINHLCVSINIASPDDFDSVTREIIQFDRGESVKTHTITINDDDECNGRGEVFTSNIVLESGIQQIDVVEPRALIIIDDRDEPECGKNYTEVMAYTQQYDYNVLL